MAKQRFFVAGTDTDVGKTRVSAALLALAKQQGLRSLGLKPIAAGCHIEEGELRNEDALTLMEHSSVSISYAEVNPVALESPIAPHIAAAQQERQLSADRIVAFSRGAMMNPADFVIVEGAGGWRVPLNHRETLAEVPKQLSLPVILVVGMKLGCLSHALLTVEAIQRDGLALAGWVANSIDPDMSCPNENLATLQRMIPAPCLGVVPWLEALTIEQVAEHLSLSPLIDDH